MKVGSISQLEIYIDAFVTYPRDVIQPIPVHIYTTFGLTHRAKDILQFVCVICKTYRLSA